MPSHFLTRIPVLAGVDAATLLAKALDSFAVVYGRPFNHVHFERDDHGKPVAFWIG